MKSWIVMGLVGAVATPMAVQTAMDSVGGTGSLDGDSDIWAKAQEIAAREYAAGAEVRVEEIWVTSERRGAFGERIHPDPGYQFHVARITITNSGKVDLSVASWQITGVDEAGSDLSPEGGNAHEDFDGGRLGVGRSRTGTVLYELREGSYLNAIVFEGFRATGTGEAGPGVYK